MPRRCKNNNLILCPKVFICANLKAEIFKLELYWRTQIHNDKYWKVALSVNDSNIILLIMSSNSLTHIELIWLFICYVFCNVPYVYAGCKNICLTLSIFIIKSKQTNKTMKINVHNVTRYSFRQREHNENCLPCVTIYAMFMYMQFLLCLCWVWDFVSHTWYFHNQIQTNKQSFRQREHKANVLPFLF